MPRPRTARVTSYDISARAGRKIPALKIAILSDLHCNSSFMTLQHLAALVTQTNQLKPDLILLLGDYAGHVLLGAELDPAEVATEFSQLNAPFGTHAVFGNHDWYSDPKARQNRTPTMWHRAFDAAGISTYSNRAITLETQPPIALAGLESQRVYRSSSFRQTPGYDDWPALANALDPGVFTLLMAHEPDIFPKLPDWVDLMVSGHTHGGQVAPFGIPFILPPGSNRKYAYGHICENDKQLIISRGLGYSTVPLRIGCPPEIVILNLTPTVKA